MKSVFCSFQAMAVVFTMGAPATGIRSWSSIATTRRATCPAISGCRGRPSLIISATKSGAVRGPRQVGSSLKSDSLPDKELGNSRRQALLQILVAGISFPAIASGASAEADLQNFQNYVDEENKFRIAIPQEWFSGKGESSTIKSVTAFFPEPASETNVSVVITGIGPDFTRLESFGKVDEFAESLVTGLDRSWRRPPGLAAKLIDSKAKNGFYYIEYTLQNPGERKRHILSAIGMANNGWYNRLYTITGQFFEDESDKVRAQIEKSVSSFRFT
ncbi:photosystem II reaction center PsbP family protein isoform X2 [Wolffia australiana]